MHKIKVEKDKEECIRLLGEAVGNVFEGEVVADGFTLKRMNVKSPIKPVAKGKVLDGEHEHTAVVEVSFYMGKTFIMFMLGVMLALFLFGYTIQRVIPNGDMLYLAQLLVLSVLVIFGVLVFNYQVNKTLNAIEGCVKG